MNSIELSTGIQTLLSLGMLVLIVFLWWPGQRIDIFRQQMFTLRDELFDFALSGGIEFDNPAYRQLRELMNGFIRYAHNVTPYRTLMSYLRWKSTSSEPIRGWSAAWEQALSEVKEKDARDKLVEFHSKASMLVFSQLALNPALLITFMPGLILVVLLRSQWTTLRKIYVDLEDKVPMDLLEEEAAKS